MANPTGAVSAKKTGKPRKKAELAHFEQIGCEQAHYEQAHCEQAHCEQTHCEQAGPVGAKSNQAGLKQKGQTTAFNKQKNTLVLTNCTNSPRGIAFKNGIVILQRPPSGAYPGVICDDPGGCGADVCLAGHL